MLCIVARDGRFARVNPAWTRILGWSADELYSRPFSDFVHPDDRHRSGIEVEHLQRGEETLHFRNRYLHQDGSYHWIDWHANLDPDTVEIYASGRDVTREVRLVQHLASREELLTTMVAQQLRARDDEHRRIASDLHDSAMQHSVAAAMYLELVPVGDPAVGRPVGMARTEVDLTLEATRSVMRGVDPFDHGDKTFSEAVHAIAKDTIDRFAIPVEVSTELDGPVGDLNGAALCRMVREALTNAAKHARPTKVHVLIGSDGRHVWAAVSDDGRGIRAATGDGPGRSGMGFGLAFLHERAASLDGSLDVGSTSEGTTIRMSIPHGAPAPAFGEDLDGERTGEPHVADH